MVKLTTRNLEKVRVRVYAIDLSTYFRAEYGIAGIENLDIEVIEATKTFTSKTPEYQKYEETERQIEVPVEGVGAWIVKVDEGDLESTVLALRSDLFLVTRSTREDLVVYAENALTGTALEAVDLVVSDGNKVLFEGRTNEKGLFYQRHEALRSARDLRVFASASVGVAASGVSLNGLSASSGLGPKGYLFTDRSAYEPGETVTFHAILRDVKNGQYFVRAEEPYLVEWISPKFGVASKASVKLSEFGSLQSRFELPETAALGAYSVRLRPQDEESKLPSYTTAFTVARYEAPRFRLEVDLEQAIVFRGEKVRGKLRASYFHGGPAPGLAARVTLPNVGMQEGRTDARGEFAFEFVTEELLEEATLQMVANLSEEGVSTQQRVRVARIAQSVSIGTLRDVYLAGESFDANVRVQDLFQKPVMTDATLFVYELVKQGRSRVEKLVQEHALRTDEGGLAIQSLALASGGAYRLRARSKDRFGHEVHATKDITISGEEDAIKLRILTARDTLKVGERVSLRLISRLPTRRVLVAHVADGIVNHEVREVRRGESEFTFDVAADLAPNFALTLTTASERKVHAVTKDFRVDRGLRVEVKPSRAEVKPGTEATAEIFVTDPAGKPVAAELVLSVLDQAFLARHPDQVPGIEAYFEGVRNTGSRASSSVLFAYQGQTRSVAAALLEEEARNLKRQQEQTRRSQSVAAFSIAPQAGGGAPTTPNGPVTGAARPSNNLESAIPQLMDLANGIEAQGELPGNEAFYFGAQFANDKAFDQRARQEMRFLFSNAGEAPNEPRVDFRSTAFVTAVRTDEAGRATVRFTMPDSLTAWRWKARGITKTTLVGEGEASSRTKLPLGAELKIPTHLMQGDEVRVTAGARNLSTQKVDVDLEVSVRGLQGEGTRAASSVDAGRALEAELALKAEQPGEAQFTVEGRVSGGPSDRLERSLAILPYASKVVARKTGALTDSARVDVQLPEGKTYTQRSLIVEVSAQTTSALAEMALALDSRSFRTAGCLVRPPLLSGILARGLAALEVHGLRQRQSLPDDETSRRLKAQIETTLERVYSAQNSDGGFDWIGAGGKRRGSDSGRSEVVVSARSLTFLARARKLGFAVPDQVLSQAYAYAQGLLAGADNEARARLAAAMSFEREPSFALLNRLERFQGSLDVITLSQLALAYFNGGRREKALSVAQVALKALQREGETAFLAGKPGHPVLSDSLEATASILRVLALLEKRTAESAALEAWVRTRWQGASFGSDQGTEAAFAALTALANSAPARGDDFTLQVYVADKLLGTLKVPGEQEHQVFRLALGTEAATLRFQFEGQGSARYAVTLEGWIEGVDEAARDAHAKVWRTYRPAPLRYRGKAIEGGFRTVSIEKPWTNTTKEARLGSSIRVETRFTMPRRFVEETSQFVVEDPLPAGMMLQPGSVSGSFAHYEQSADRLLFFLAPGVRSGLIRYELLGYLPGSYRALPVRVWPYTHPERMSVSQEDRLRVLARDEASTETYRMTPDELYHFGKAEYEAGDKERALERLEAFLNGFKVLDRYHKEAARMVFLASLEKKDSARIVNYFEVLKERYPSLVLSFEQMLQVGDSYLAMKEQERAYEVFRGIAEASFLREVGVAGTLEQQGQFLASIAFLQRLVREYPDLPVVLETAARIPQLVYSRREKGVESNGKRLSSTELLTFTSELAQEYLALYPESRLADEVAFGRVSANLEDERFESVVDRCGKYADLYQESEYLDDLLYMGGYARFALGRYDEALQVLGRVREDRFPTARGELAPASNRDLATHMVGQIHHARRRFEDAIEAYGQVRKEFRDADLAIEQLERKELTLPEVTSVGPGEAAKVMLSSRNLKSAGIRVYRVDLVRLYLVQKSLDQMTGIKLSGITPTHETEVDLGEGMDYTSRKTELTLPLEERGAYLVVAQAEGLSAAGMFLRTDLELEVLTEVATGLVRVGVRTRSGDPVPRAHVKVVGSVGGQIQGADTDLRGVATLESVTGKPTIVVRDGERVAFHRGKESLRVTPQRSQGGQQRYRNDFNAEAQRRLRSVNEALQMKGGRALEGLMRNKQAGVEVHRAIK